MSPQRPMSPWLGGAGARWAQVLLFALHLALLVSLVYLVVTFRDVRHNVPFEPWQETVLLIIVGLSFLVFARRAWRIGADLWRAMRGLEPPDANDEFEDDERPES
ncbi:MAG TPA: hypothetical protein VGR66_06665 [Candidatus Eisenbacteria bacterium]|nr:hypothetical protein [Candidatus Eisenbacteria bacterium]